MFNNFKIRIYVSILYATSVLACWDALSGFQNEN